MADVDDVTAYEESDAPAQSAAPAFTTGGDVRVEGDPAVHATLEHEVAHAVQQAPERDDDIEIDGV